MNAIEFKSVSKKFKKGESFDSLRDFIPNIAKGFLPWMNGKEKDVLHSKEFWALKDVSFELKRGECLGIIGPNGSGKSTTLKLLCNILKPTQGEIKINGKLSALIEVGAGFHPDLTGRENVYLNGAILGMKKREIDKKFDSIVTFSELEEFIDTPVKRYSSGMYARLGFSVAAHLDPDILLVDEVLSVGDLYFQTKCFEKIKTLKLNGQTIVFISHNMEAMLNLCSRTILLYKGNMLLQGKTEDVVREYQSSVQKQMLKNKAPSELLIHIKDLLFLDTSGNRICSLQKGDSLNIKVNIESRELIKNAVLKIFFYDQTGICIYGHNSKVDKYNLGDINGTVELQIEYPNISFQPGTYFVTVALYDWQVMTSYEYLDRQFSFSIYGDKNELGIVSIPHIWKSGKSYIS